MKKEVAKVLEYFKIFAYHPTLDELYMFLPIKINKVKLKYTPPQYGIGRKISNIKYQISKRKLQNWRYRIYIKLLALFPQIKLIGLSGSISMMNATEEDDIDLFIITVKNRLFTGRLIASILTLIFGLKRSRKKQNNKNKVCLNLFFDESNLRVPKFKQTLFVGHEVLQMKPVAVKGDTYQRFLEENRWVQSFFPNSSWIISKIKNQKLKTNSKFKTLIFKLGFDICTLIFDFFEKIFKKLQLTLINRHHTTEIITPTQLWFHPDDFEKKISKKFG